MFVSVHYSGFGIKGAFTVNSNKVYRLFVRFGTYRFYLQRLLTSSTWVTTFPTTGISSPFRFIFLGNFRRAQRYGLFGR